MDEYYIYIEREVSKINLPVLSHHNIKNKERDGNHFSYQDQQPYTHHSTHRDVGYLQKITTWRVKRIYKATNQIEESMMAYTRLTLNQDL